MTIEVETRAVEVESGWRDNDGFTVSFNQGEGPRTNPRGEFPTGPAVGSPMPNVQSTDSFGNVFDLHTVAKGKPAIFIFQRSAVW